jgi:hypothetical protein
MQVPSWVKRIVARVIAGFCPQGAVMARAIVASSADLRLVHEQSDDYTDKVRLPAVIHLR